MPRCSESQVFKNATDEFFGQIQQMANLPSIEYAVSMLMGITTDEFEAANANLLKHQQFRIPKEPSNAQIAELIPLYYKVCRIACAGESKNESLDLLGIYQEDGPNQGLYATDEATLRKIVKKFRFSITHRDLVEILAHLRDISPRKVRYINPNIIPVNNGIYDFRNKRLWEFTPDIVLLSKCRVDYNHAAQNIIIHNDEDGTDWDVESWMQSLSDDPEIVQLLWQIVGAIIRPFVSWDKAIFLYSQTGSNGKGTLCELLRQLCGEGTYASIPLADMGKEFLLEPLTRASAVIVDENNVGSYIDRAGVFKAIVTHDVIQINRKYKDPIAYRFYGLIVQCINELPRVKDKSNSFYRRQLIIPMTKRFLGHERKYIKQEYLHNPAVLQYVLQRVLEMDYYEFIVPAACAELQKEYQEYNDPLREFVREILPKCRWHLLPFTFLYELYKEWFKKNQPSGSPLGRNTFINDLVKIIEDDSEWYCPDRKKKIMTNNKTHNVNLIDTDEPLIGEYHLKDWISVQGGIPVYFPADLKDSYRGLLRKTYAYCAG